MSIINQLRIQQAFREHANFDHWPSPHAVTLTMKQGVRDPLEPSHATEYLTREKAEQNFRHFMNRLNRQVLGKRFQHHGVRLPVIPVVEGTRSKRMHYHAIIDCPRSYLKERFPELIQNLWSNTRFGYRQIEVKPNCDQGWANYISKLNDKASIADAIDWMNYHNPN